MLVPIFALPLVLFLQAPQQINFLNIIIFIVKSTQPSTRNGDDSMFYLRDDAVHFFAYLGMDLGLGFRYADFVPWELYALNTLLLYVLGETVD